MQIDYCLILAAGFGTRMGEIGKSLPKVLWPVFEKSLLELQVEYAKSLGIQKIFINLHHQKDIILDYVQGKSVFEGVTFLLEEKILDIGGGVHNLARKVGYQGNLLVLNADQFFLMSKDFIADSVKNLKNHPALLFSFQVDPRLGYNCLKTDANNLLTEIIPAKELTQTSVGMTYTGNSLVNLGAIKPVEGVSSFFDSVAIYKEEKIAVKSVGDLSYWDFGTAQRYWLSMRKILETYRAQSTHPFIRFLVQARALKTWKIDLTRLSYHAKGNEVIHLGNNADESHSSQIISLSERSNSLVAGPSIIYKEFEEKINL